MKKSEIIIKIVKEGKHEAIKNLKHFLELLDLNPEAFNHLYDIYIKLGNTFEGSSAKYSCENNYIILDIYYLEELAELYITSGYNEKTLNNCILNVALTIIHETIHANRTIIIENSVNSLNIDTNNKTTEITLASDNYLGKMQDKDKIEERLANMNGFEELITEAIAIIIMFARNDKTLDLDDVCNKILNSKGNYDDSKVPIKFLKNMGIDIIKWFLTSVYNEYYIDELELIFKDKYDDLLYDFNDIYEANMYGEEPNDYSAKDIDEIVRNRKR